MIMICNSGNINYHYLIEYYQGWNGIRVEIIIIIINNHNDNGYNGYNKRDGIDYEIIIMII